MGRRWFILAYGVSAYVLFLGVFLYAIGFIGNFGTPTTLDGEPRVSVGAAVGVNLVLLVLFAVQHSGMARPGFKRWVRRHIPDALERSTYVLATNVALLAMFALWQPLPGVVWRVESPAGRAALYTLFGIGWATVLVTTFLINHFDLFGLRQTWFGFRRRPYEPVPFVTPLPYRWVRHPLYVGWLTVFWATPTMGLAHLLFAAGTTLYILGAIVLEERDLVAAHPEYEAYRRATPALLPRVRPRRVAARA